MSEEFHESQSEPRRLSPFPSVGQSFLVCIITLVVAVVFCPLIFLRSLIGDEPAIMIYYVVAFGVSFVLLHTMRVNQSGERRYRLWLGSWRLVVLVILGTLALMLGVVGPLSGLVPIPNSVVESLTAAAGQRGWATFVFMVLAAPVLEELIFRGIMLDGLLQRCRPVTAILLSSLLFGLVHLNPVQFVTGLVLGFFLGWVYWRTRSVGLCMVIHMTANLSGFVIRFFMDAEAAMDRDAGYLANYGGVGPFVTIVALAWVVIALVVWLLRREFRRRDGASPWVARKSVA